MTDADLIIGFNMLALMEQAWAEEGVSHVDAETVAVIALSFLESLGDEELQEVLLPHRALGAQTAGDAAAAAAAAAALVDHLRGAGAGRVNACHVCPLHPVVDLGEAAGNRRRMLEQAYPDAGALHRVRIHVPDRPGVLAAITQALGAERINIEDLEMHHVSQERGGELELVIAGEFAVSLPSAEYRTKQLEEKGAPISWHCPEPVPLTISEIIVLKGGNTNASLMFVNWFLSKEGQISQYVADLAPPVHKDLQIREFLSYPDEILGRPYAYLDPDLLERDLDKMLKLWEPLWYAGKGLQLKVVTTSLSSVDKGGRSIAFNVDGAPQTAKVSDDATRINIKGETAEPASLAAGIAPAGEIWSVVTSSPSTSSGCAAIASQAGGGAGDAAGGVAASDTSMPGTACTFTSTGRVSSTRRRPPPARGGTARSRPARRRGRCGCCRAG